MPDHDRHPAEAPTPAEVSPPEPCAEDGPDPSIPPGGDPDLSRAPLLLGVGLAFGAEIGATIGVVAGSALGELALCIITGTATGGLLGVLAGSALGRRLGAGPPGGTCPHCGYPRRGLPGTTCPECGGCVDRPSPDALAPPDGDDDDARARPDASRRPDPS